MSDTPLSIGVALALVMLMAAGSDLRSRRIPNALTLAGVLAAPVLWWLADGFAAAAGSVAGAGLAFVVGILLFATKGVGGGDAKLLVVTGAFFGPSRLGVALLAIGIVGGVLALLVALARGRLAAAISGAWNLSVHLTTLGHKGTARGVTSPGAWTIPYGVAIAVGSLMAWYFYASGTIAG